MYNNILIKSHIAKAIASIFINAIIAYCNVEYLIIVNTAMIIMTVLFNKSIRNIYYTCCYFWITVCIFLVFNYTEYGKQVNFLYLTNSIFNQDILKALIYISIIKHSHKIKLFNTILVDFFITFLSNVNIYYIIFSIFITEYILSWFIPSVIIRANFSYNIISQIKSYISPEHYHIICLSMLLANSLSTTIIIKASFTNSIFLKIFNIPKELFNNYTLLLKIVQFWIFAPVITIILLSFFFKMDCSSYVIPKNKKLDSYYYESQYVALNWQNIAFVTLFILVTENILPYIFQINFYTHSMRIIAFIIMYVCYYFLFFPSARYAIKVYFKEYECIQWTSFITQHVNMALKTNIIISLLSHFQFNFLINMTIIYFSSFFLSSLSSKINIINLITVNDNLSQNKMFVEKNRSKHIIKYYEIANTCNVLLPVTEKIFFKDIAIQNKVKYKIFIIFSLFNIIFIFIWWLLIN